MHATHDLNVSLRCADTWHIVDDMGCEMIKVGLNAKSDMEFSAMIEIKCSDLTCHMISCLHARLVDQIKT